MARKLVELPLKSYLYKFVLVEEQFIQGIFAPSKRFTLPTHTNWNYHKHYFDKAKDDPGTYPAIKVWTHNHRPEKLYQYIAYFEQRFIDKFTDYVEVRMGIKTEMQSIRDFLDKYDLTEHDYKEASIWRRWMRIKKDKQLSA